MPGSTYGSGKLGHLRDDVTVHIASLNTRPATELCIRTMRLNAGHQFRLIVGDGGSTDGSVEMLENFQQRGWLTLQRHPHRSHAAWLDAWRSHAESRYLVFVDSDMDFRRPNWLRQLIDHVRASGAAIVALDIKPLTINAREPVSGRLVRGMPAPTTWLMLLDAPQLAGLRSGFGFRKVETDAVPEGCIVYDVGASLFEEMQARGLEASAMSASYRAGVKHYGSMTWGPDAGEIGRRKRRNLAVIERRLRGVRALETGGNPVRRAVVMTLLNPWLEQGLEILARLRWRAARSLQIQPDQPVFVPDSRASVASIAELSKPPPPAESHSAE